MENCNGCGLKDIFETTVINYGSKKNCKTLVTNCGFKYIFEITINFQNIFKTIVTKFGSKKKFKNNLKITILTIENCNGVWFKDICETTVSNYSSNENCKARVCDCGF